MACGRWSPSPFPSTTAPPATSFCKELRWLGFAPLYDGLWVAPRDHVADVLTKLKDLGISTATAFRATAVPGSDGESGIPARSWDLDGLKDRYERFISFAGQLRDSTASGLVSPLDALVARTRVMDEWRAFPGMDPDLPAELLPDAWPRCAARDVFITCYDLLGPLAARRVRQVIARTAPSWPTWPPTTARRSRCRRRV